MDGVKVLIWTTTPWTLPANLAVMVGSGIDYVVVASEATGTRERYLLAEARLGAYARELGEAARGALAPPRRRPGGTDLHAARSPTTPATRTPSAWSRPTTP